MGLWVPSSEEMLAKAEAAILRCIPKTTYSIRDVMIELPSKGFRLFGRSSAQNTHQYNIRTISFDQQSQEQDQHSKESSKDEDTKRRWSSLPLVMIHGFGSGLGLWVLNYETLAATAPVHALDLLGFANSSRNYNFSKDSQTCVDEYVESLEQWRKAMSLDKFVLVGHSFGAYLSYFYMLKHPTRVQHLVLADPWGLTLKTEEAASRFKVHWALSPLVYLVTKFNPLAILRVSGRLAPSLIPKLRTDILSKFNSVYDHTTDSTIADYIYHCNVQRPSGEAAFHNICSPLPWPREGMIQRVDQVPEDSRITMLLGSESWMWRYKDVAYRLQKQLHLKGVECQLSVLPASSHHVYADEPDLFNSLISQVMEHEVKRMMTSSSDNSTTVVSSSSRSLTPSSSTSAVTAEKQQHKQNNII
ncbi:(Lyso)-N-acylphosphatidylethanolamine lipase-like [Symsagittifera roscoffensis]|uniref:(Lyso)-N-acylphosphatidylethanolamine lipase-like n=1 Tax=Symsagittifera roscoffensis TaxID=84072 RepID=UPI00307C2CB2